MAKADFENAKELKKNLPILHLVESTCHKVTNGKIFSSVMKKNTTAFGLNIIGTIGVTNKKLQLA